MSRLTSRSRRSGWLASVRWFPVYLLSWVVFLVGVSAIAWALQNVGLSLTVAFYLSFAVLWSAMVVYLIRRRNPRFDQLLFRCCFSIAVESAIFAVAIGIAIVFSTLGVTFNLGLFLGVGLGVVLMAVMAYRQQRILAQHPTTEERIHLKGAIKFADWIAQTLATKAPREWDEYQDWLHDILLDYRRALDLGMARWQVSAIVYWRLIGFCLVVSVMKLKRMAGAARRS